MPDLPDVIEGDEQDLRVAVRHSLDRSGFTFQELQAQAASGDFESVRARMAWVAIGDLGALADEV